MRPTRGVFLDPCPPPKTTALIGIAADGTRLFRFEIHDRACIRDFVPELDSLLDETDPPLRLHRDNVDAASAVAGAAPTLVTGQRFRDATIAAGLPLVTDLAAARLRAAPRRRDRRRGNSGRRQERD
jgi:hypothetical protein